MKKNGYFTDLENFKEYYSLYGKYLRLVTVNDDEQIYCENDKYKAHKIILSEKNSDMPFRFDIFFGMQKQ